MNQFVCMAVNKALEHVNCFSYDCTINTIVFVVEQGLKRYLGVYCSFKTWDQPDTIVTHNKHKTSLHTSMKHYCPIVT